MSRFVSQATSLGRRSLIAAGAATLMVGGGVAVAQTGLPLAEEKVDDNTPAEKSPELPELPVQPSEDVGETDPDEKDDDDAKNEGGGQESDIQELDTDLDDLEEGAGEDQERSETAQRVHEALTGRQASPGEEDFGQIVSERARTYRLGPAVSAAAHGEDWEEHLEEKPARDNDDVEESTGDTVEQLSDDAADDKSGKPSWAGTPGGPNSAGQR